LNKNEYELDESDKISGKKSKREKRGRKWMKSEFLINFNKLE